MQKLLTTLADLSAYNVHGALPEMYQLNGHYVTALCYV
jgi:hypothetical protein